IGVGIAPRRDQPDVLRHRRVRRTRPLAVDHLVEVVGIGRIGRLHARAPRGLCGLPLSDHGTHSLGLTPRRRALIAAWPRQFPLIWDINPSTARRNTQSLETFMDIRLSPEQEAIAQAVTKLCAGFGDDYWTACDTEARFPHEFHRAVAEAGFLGIAMPVELGGAGLGVTEAAIMMHA